MDPDRAGTMGGVTGAEDREARRQRYVTASSRRVWRITAVACVAILGLGLGSAAVIQQQALQARQDDTRTREQARDRALAEQLATDLACVKRWADAYTKRADRLNELATLRSDALDRLVLAAAGRSAAVKHARLLDYLQASARYRATTQHDPLPASPVFACGQPPTSGPSPYRPPATTPNRVPDPPSTSPHPPASSSASRTSGPPRATGTSTAGRVGASGTSRPPATRTVAASSSRPPVTVTLAPPLLPGLLPPQACRHIPPILVLRLC